MLTAGHNIGVRESLDASIPLNHTRPTASVARKPRVTHRVHVAGAHALACVKARVYRHT
jgi:hypothetical protein